jgi:O-antigen/teichoic acid export membrane protein
VLFTSTSRPLLYVAGLTVATQLLTVWGKACCQGAADMRGANLVIVAEELVFLPAYGFALLTGLRGVDAVIAGLVCGGLGATAISLGRLASTGFFRDRPAPSLELARSVVLYGARGQLGDLLWLVNLRLDFLILGVLAGPGVLGLYAVASKCAELMRLPATAVNYVLYPRFARSGRSVADAQLRRLLWRACGLTVAAAPVMAVAAVVGLPLLYGRAFQGAVLPACLLLIGLAFEGATAVSSGYLRGIGRPGTNSAGMAAGVVVTVVLDVLLIPRHGAAGAAVASSAAYLVTTSVLLVLAYRTLRRPASLGPAVTAEAQP